MFYDCGPVLLQGEISASFHLMFPLKFKFPLLYGRCLMEY